MPPGVQVRGDTARLAVRPHDLEISKDTHRRPGIRARVVRVLSAGPVVKVELLSDAGQTVFAELSHDRFRAAPCEVGEDVFLSARDSRLFVDNYQT